jgi:2-methylisocitrate lyase-like PEP mutase family enzyme
VNIEDQVSPKKCGHLEGKQIVSFDEAVNKIRAACDARKDPDFVINARTDTLAIAGMDDVIRRGNALLEVGATRVMVEGIGSWAEIEAAVKGIEGPVGINMVDGGKARFDLTFDELEAMGVARVSLPGTLLRAALRAMTDVLSMVQADGYVRNVRNTVVSFEEGIPALMGMRDIERLEKVYLTGQQGQAR